MVLQVSEYNDIRCFPTGSNYANYKYKAEAIALEHALRFVKNMLATPSTNLVFQVSASKLP